MPLVVFAFNTSAQSTTKYTPFHLLYGREASFLFDVQFTAINTMSINYKFKFEVIIADEFEKCRRMARRSFEKFQQKYKSRYESTHKEIDIFKLITKPGLSE